MTLFFRITPALVAALGLDDRGVLAETGLDLRGTSKCPALVFEDRARAERFHKELEYRSSGHFHQDGGATRACRAAARNLARLLQKEA